MHELYVLDLTYYGIYFYPFIDNILVEALRDDIGESVIDFLYSIGDLRSGQKCDFFDDHSLLFYGEGYNLSFLHSQ